MADADSRNVDDGVYRWHVTDPLRHDSKACLGALRLGRVDPSGKTSGDRKVPAHGWRWPIRCPDRLYAGVTAGRNTATSVRPYQPTPGGRQALSPGCYSARYHTTSGF